ncbi:MAG TPA: DUF2235 domain-containing protein [Lysobacter sp.]
MPKNILIFSDGTGQAGGLRPDQRLSNVYKLYRATRPGPDNPDIDPARQIAFYDPGLGTISDAGGIQLNAVQRLMSVFGQATGMGITDNIIDCYAAVLKYYRPGDRICIFGFSRGAYTARCVANVIRLCGVPTTNGRGGGLPTAGPDLREIAREAVVDVYEHRFLTNNPERVSAQESAAMAFRAKYQSNGVEAGMGNVAPAFIGVFDTVAALGVRGPRLAAFVMALAVAVAIFSLPAALVVRALFSPWISYGWAALGTFVVAGGALGLKLFRNRWKLKDYDRSLDPRTGYARHACAIDESRADFLVLGWGHSADVPKQRLERGEWFVQTWFAGNHSDIGGSYPEDESRLSDIALHWMLDELRTCVPDIVVQEDKLKLWGSSAGMQHCEVQKSRERKGLLKLLPPWPAKDRTIHPQANLHPSVLDRFALKEVPHCRNRAPYRPEALRRHEQVAHYFTEEWR